MPFMRNPTGVGRGGRGRGRGRGVGGARGGRGGPKLPSTLMAEVDTAYGIAKRGGRDTRHLKVQRKAARDEERRPPTLPRRQATPEEEPSPSPRLKKRAAPSAEALPPAPKKKKKTLLPEISLPSADQADAEDGDIEWLEWVLKKEREKEKLKAVDGEVDLDDGLDDLLELADVIGPGGAGLRRTKGRSREDDEDAEEDEEDEGDEEDGEEEESDVDALEDEESHSEDGDQGSDIGSEEDESLRDSISDNQSEKSDEASNTGSTSPASHTNGVNPLAAAGPSRYVPPQLRVAQLEERSRGNKEKVEGRIRLERKVQGLLNRLSEANIENILVEVEELYRGHSRNDVTTTLTSLIIQTISSRSNLLDSFVVLYASLIGALHRVIGMELGAHLVHTVVLRYHVLAGDGEISTPMEATIYETPDASKEGLNLLVLIAELYNAGVISAKLIYDLVRSFLEHDDPEEVMGEKEVEGLLRILRCCGSQLRSDDPGSLKDIVGLVQHKTKGKEKTMTTRARFMVETLTNVKNNKIRSASGTEQGNEAVERMRKFLSSLGRRRRLLATDPLRVGLTDLLHADTKGKWWLVGAGWSGDPLVDRQRDAPEPKKREREVEAEDEGRLLELARKQGMNTDVRRSIFVVLMSSEDYVHACDRLSHLRLTVVQQREFMRVTLHSAGLEKTYNPYYTLILNRLCSESYDHRFTLQYALWDLLRSFEDEEGVPTKEAKRKSGNVARAMAFVVARGSLDLSVFKAVEWTSLNRLTTDFLITFTIHLILATQTTSPLFVLAKSVESFDVESVEEVFKKTLSNLELAQGFLVLLRQRMEEKKGERVLEGLGIGGRQREVVARGLEVAIGILQRAV